MAAYYRPVSTRVLAPSGVVVPLSAALVSRDYEKVADQLRDHILSQFKVSAELLEGATTLSSCYAALHQFEWNLHNALL